MMDNQDNRQSTDNQRDPKSGPVRQMMLYLTLLRTGPMIARRCLAFQALGLPFVHQSLQTDPSAASGAVAFYSGRMRFARRLGLLLTGGFRLRQALRSAAEGSVLYAVGLDCLCVAIISRALSKSRIRLIYEAHDAHPYLILPSLFRSLLRAIHRRALRQIDLLIVPSQGNIDRFYRPVANYEGPYAIVQNKIASAEFSGRTSLPDFSGKWMVGWFCGLRCERTLRIICAVASKLGERVHFLIAGEDQLRSGELNALISAHNNITYLGSYTTQRDVARLYGRVHFGLACHFEPAEKSCWALPVRLFEAGAYGRPVLARATTAAGELVSEYGFGEAFEELFEDHMAAFLERLTPEGYQALAQRLNSLDLSLFVGEAQLASAIARVMPRSHN